MSASNSPLAITLWLSCVGLACAPKPTAEAAASPSESATPPVADEPTGETPAAEKPADEVPPTKCFTEGGTCVHKKATLECKRFEEGEGWGCEDENTGCCIQ
jgi:hypothetical protein